MKVHSAPAGLAEPLSAADYLSSLQHYLQGGGEAALQQAYEIGRTAITAGTGLLAIAQLHHASLKLLLERDSTVQERGRTLRGAAEFFAECISPYEMTYSGFREANIALRHFNELLEQEAKRIAHALHDEAGQLLVAVYIALQDLAQQVPQAEGHVVKAVQLLDQIETQLRRMSHELAPALLNDLGLVPALRYLSDGLAQRARLQISIEEIAGERLPRAVEATLYRVAKESLHNVLRHAQASSVSIQFRRTPDSICCHIRDDGVGFDPQTIHPARQDEQGFGLIGIRERLGILGGTLQINSAAGAGTELVMSIPVET